MAELLIIVALAAFVAMLVAWVLLPGSKPVAQAAENASRILSESQTTSAGA